MITKISDLFNARTVEFALHPQHESSCHPEMSSIVRNTKLYLPIPSAFKGIIEAGQQLGSLKIIPSKMSTIKLYLYGFEVSLTL